MCVFCNFIFWFHLPCSFPTVNSLCDRHDHRLEQNIILNWVSKDRPSSQRNQTNLKMDCHVNKHLRGAEPIPCLKKVTVKKLLIPTWQIYSPESSRVTACKSKTDGSPGSAILLIKVKLYTGQGQIISGEGKNTCEQQWLPSDSSEPLDWDLPPQCKECSDP